MHKIVEDHIEGQRISSHMIELRPLHRMLRLNVKSFSGEQVIAEVATDECRVSFSHRQHRHKSL